jgi:hypothetical protein
MLLIFANRMFRSAWMAAVCAARAAIGLGSFASKGDTEVLLVSHHLSVTQRMYQRLQLIFRPTGPGSQDTRNFFDFCDSDTAKTRCLRAERSRPPDILYHTN